MFNKLNINIKIILLVTTIVIISVVSDSVISFYRTKKEIQRSYFIKLQMLSSNYQHQIDIYFEDIKEKLEYVSSGDKFKKVYKELYLKPMSVEADSLRKEIAANYIDRFININKFKEIILINNHSDIIYQSNDITQRGQHKFRTLDNLTVDIRRGDYYINAPVREGKHFYNYVCLPILLEDDIVIGQIICKFEARDVFSILKIDSVDMKYDFIAYKNYHQEIYQLNKENYPKIYTEGEDDPMYQTLVNPEVSSQKGIYLDKQREKEIKYQSLWTYYKKLGIGLQVRTKEVYANLETSKFNMYTVIIGVGIIIVALVLTILFTQTITYPIHKLRKILGLVSMGVLPQNINTKLKDEIGDMIRLMNNIIAYLKRSAVFASDIGQQKFDSDYQPISNKDILGKALLDMQTNLQEVDNEDNLRNWVTSGVAQISEILRNSDNIHYLSDNVLKFLCKTTSSQQGAFYIVNHKKGKTEIELIAGFAHGKKKHLEKIYTPGQGLIGQAFLEQDYIIRTEIPENYFQISSGLLGKKKPKTIIIAPLKTNNIVYGIIELGSIKTFDRNILVFLQEIGSIVSQTIFNIRVNDHTKQLLDESQRMSEELKEQQGQLQQSADKMTKAQVELTRSNEALEKKVAETSEAQDRTNSLLENASELIMIYDKKGLITYVSPSVYHITGYREDDLLGKNDKHLIEMQSALKFQEMFQELLMNKISTTTLKIQYYKKDGSKIWLEATGSNMLNVPSIKGIVVNYQDITEQIRAKEEERKKGQMQALSENSLDIIIRIGTKDNKIYYVNPTIKKYAKLLPNQLINKKIEESGLNERIVKDLSTIVQKVTKEKEKIKMELTFPTDTGELITEVNGIPEYGANEEVDFVLVVLHDITEKKKNLLELRHSTNQIKDSINYAENIQRAIIPDSTQLQQQFKESFIYFRPRDIVSGDFPWMYTYGEVTFVAAVDCTGHGVPGAMISFVGYFLLKNIIENHPTLNAGEVLDQLDTALANTFQKAEGNDSIKDGMDVAICKIDKSSKTLEFAGAQRPMYLVKKNGVLYEIKGSKFPIGGGDSYTKTGFVNNKSAYEEGDTIYIFSDGLPDQFGGKGNQKFGIRRIRSIIEKEGKDNLGRFEKLIDKQLVDWQGDVEQTDDILLIGLKLL